jgi:hypothetical protein
VEKGNKKLCCGTALLPVALDLRPPLQERGPTIHVGGLAAISPERYLTVQFGLLTLITPSRRKLLAY